MKGEYLSQKSHVLTLNLIKLLHQISIFKFLLLLVLIVYNWLECEFLSTCKAHMLRALWRRSKDCLSRRFHVLSYLVVDSRVMHDPWLMKQLVQLISMVTADSLCSTDLGGESSRQLCHVKLAPIDKMSALLVCHLPSQGSTHSPTTICRVSAVQVLLATSQDTSSLLWRFACIWSLQGASLLALVKWHHINLASS